MTGSAPIQPVPLPTQWAFDHTADGRFVVAVANNPAGTSFYFLDVDQIEQFVIALKAQARNARRAANGKSETELVIPANVVLGPDGQPLVVVPPSEEVQDMADKMAERQAAWPDPVDEPAPDAEETGDDPLLG